MTFNKTGFIASGYAHPEINPGDIYRDGYGYTVTVRTVTPERVTYNRDGYAFDCISSRMRFEKEFSLIKKQVFQAQDMRNSALEKIQKLREQIHGSSDHQHKDDRESEE